MITSDDHLKNKKKKKTIKRPSAEISKVFKEDLIQSKDDSQQSSELFLENSSPTKLHKRKEFKCDQCKYTTDRKNNLKRHIITMHETCKQILECCGQQFESKSSFRSHNYVYHKDGYRCAICERRFCRKVLLLRHQSVHNGRKDFVCTECGYRSSHKSNLERHKKIHIKSSNKTCSSASSADVMLPLKKRKYLWNPTDGATKKIAARHQNNSKKIPVKSLSTTEPSPSPPPILNYDSSFESQVIAEQKKFNTLNNPNVEEIQGKNMPLQFTWPPLTTNHSPGSYIPYVNNTNTFDIGLPVDMSKFNNFEHYNGHDYLSTAYSGHLLSPSVCGSLESTSSRHCSHSDSENCSPRIMAKPRLCASPYKCFNCCELFSSQVQLTCHNQYLHPDNDVVTLSIVNVIKKMNKFEGGNSSTVDHLVKKDELQRFLLQNY